LSNYIKKESKQIWPGLALFLLKTIYAHKIKGIYIFGYTKMIGSAAIAGVSRLF